MVDNILSNEAYTLKLTSIDVKNLIRFCMITPPIFDAVNSMLEQIKAVESYIKEWQELEKPVSDIIGNIKKET